MTDWITRLSDENARTALGHRFEALADEAFNVVRWTVVVGFARFLSTQTGGIWFSVIHWALAGLLLAYIASRFLLRPEVPVFARTDTRWKRIVQTVLNILLCMAAFILVMLALEILVDAIATYRFAPAAT